MNNGEPIKRRGIKAREIAMVIVAFGLLARHITEVPFLASFIYPFISYGLGLDNDIVPIKNHEGEIESEIFTHRFIDVYQSYRGVPVNVTYHYVECGSKNAEPIIFLHGLGETWKVWKEVMKPFCGK